MFVSNESTMVNTKTIQKIPMAIPNTDSTDRNLLVTREDKAMITLSLNNPMPGNLFTIKIQYYKTDFRISPVIDNRWILNH